MSKTLVILPIIALCGAFVAPVAASVDGEWHLRFIAANLDPNLNQTAVNDDGDDIHLSAGTDLGFGASLEYQFGRTVGLELGVLWGSPEIRLNATTPTLGPLSLSDDLTTRMITFDLNFHLTPNSSRVDFYVGVGIASLGFGNLHVVDPFGNPLDLSVDDDLSWSAKANLEIGLGASSKWAAFAGLRYTDSDLEARLADQQVTNTFDFGIASLSVGVARSF